MQAETPDPQRRTVAILLLCAALAFFASTKSLSLLSLDDCFYARKGIELGRSGRFFTVTWNYQATFQNPPLQFWILGRFFQWLGENDLSARLPSILMALGIVALTYRIGRMVMDGPAALLGVCALLLTPQFVSNARRCMLEVPTTFWITLCFWVLLEGFRRPRIHLLLSAPLGGALLTKSLLGLLPLPVFAVFCLLHGPARASLRKPWIWAGIAAGLAIGATWPVHEWMTFGPDAIRLHYMGEIASRSTQSLSLAKRLFGYPLILLGSFQPLILPAVAGAWFLWKKRSEPAGLLLAWAILPVLIYSFSSARSSRYLFPLLPAMALCAGWALGKLPSGFTTAFCRWITPTVLLLVSAVLWMRPEWIVQDENVILKGKAAQLQRIPEEEPIAYYGDHYWQIANPLLYYADRFLESPAQTPQNALERARNRRSASILCDRERCDELGIANQVLLQTPDWQLIKLHSQPQ